MASEAKLSPPLDLMDNFPFRGEYGGSRTGALFFVTIRSILPLLFYSLLAPSSSPYSLFVKISFAAPSQPPPTANDLSIPGLPNTILHLLSETLSLSPPATTLFLAITLSTLSFTAYNLIWRRERFPLSGQGGAFQITTQVNIFDSLHALLFVYFASRNPTWSPELFRWMPPVFVLGLIIHMYADHSKYLFRKEPKNREKVKTDGVWGVVRHPNFLGFTIWRTAFACMAGGWGFGVLALGMFVLLFRNTSVPTLEGYMERKYGEEWESAKEKVPSKILPGVW